MSQIETHLGKLIPIGKKLTTDNVVDILDGKYDFFMSPLDNLYECFYNKYYVDEDNNIYEVVDKKLESEDIFKSNRNNDGSIDYIIQFYNGGCSFTEALDSALKNIKNND